MSTDPPLVCSLGAGDLAVRQAEIADLGREALLDVHRDGTRVELRFAARPGVRERVESVVAAEGECCAFLAMRVGEATDAVVVTIDAPEGAEVVITDMVELFGGHPPGAA